MVKIIRLALFLFPFYAQGQSKSYFSGEAIVNFGRALDYTGYGVNVSGNFRLHDRIYVGLVTGFVKLQPFTSQPAFPLSGRITFFTSEQQEKIAPFAMFEVGKIFYKENGFAGSPYQTLEGKLNFFTGVGIKVTTRKNLRPYFALGYAGYYFENKNFDAQNILAFKKDYRFRRIELRVGVSLPLKK